MILVVDGQGGGIGKALVSAIKAAFPSLEGIAAGTNALATSAMLKSGADKGATGENAIAYLAAKAQVILGPIGLLQQNAMLGEVSPPIVNAISQSSAAKILIPIALCPIHIAGTPQASIGWHVEQATAKLEELLSNAKIDDCCP